MFESTFGSSTKVAHRFNLADSVVAASVGRPVVSTVVCTVKVFKTTVQLMDQSLPPKFEYCCVSMLCFFPF